MSVSPSAERIKAIEEYVGSLGLDAYVVGGVVRDELLGREPKDADFLVPGLSSEQLRDALSAHGRVEELVVAGRPVGMRLYPRDARLRALAPAGIEFAPLRREGSNGPGRHDFEIVVDPQARVEDDLQRRDFTVNAIARRLADGTLVDPFGGRADLERGVLRTVGSRSFAEDPLRIVRGLRFVSELGLEPEPGTLAQMEAEAGSVALVSGERIGGGLGADGMGELSKLLLGARPGKALALARDTGVLVAILRVRPGDRPAPARPRAQPRRAHPARRPGRGRRRHAAARAAGGAAPRPRQALARCGRGRRRPCGARGAELADPALRRLRYPNGLRRASSRSSASTHSSSAAPTRARRGGCSRSTARS